MRHTRIVAGTILMAAVITCSHAINVADINMGYNQEQNKIRNLIASVKKSDNKFRGVIDMLKSNMEVQFSRDAGMMSSEKQSELLLKEIGTYSQMELLRAEGVMMQAKELIFESWRKSNKISKDEIEEKFQENKNKQ